MKNFLKKQENSFENKNRILLLAVLTIFVSIAGWSLWDIWHDYHVPAEEVVNSAVIKTLSAENYQFKAQAVRETDGVRKEICIITGEIEGENAHLSGNITLVDGEFELYQIGDKYYRRDSADGKWLVVEDMGRESARKLIAEISPFDFLKLEAPFEVEYLGKEIVNEEKCRKFQVMNYVTNEYLTYDWQEIFLTLWINKRGYIIEAQIRAQESDEPTKELELNLSFSFDKDLPLITAPLR